jgi:hypothetical protein
MALRGGIMDYLRILKVPFQATSLILVGIITPIASFLIWGLINTPAGVIGSIGLLLLQLWFFNYCFEVIERVANGTFEPPVLDAHMLSPFARRPWTQIGLLAGAAALCLGVGGKAGAILGVIFILWIPASLTILGADQPVLETLNPLTVFRLIRGLGPHYLLLLAAMAGGVGLVVALVLVALPLLIKVLLLLLYELSFAALVGGTLYVRREQTGFVPMNSPERKADRDERERVERRSKMLDEVFTNVRIGKHVDATAPLAAWLGHTSAEEAIRDSYHVAEQALGWGNAKALNTIGSTLIRHLLRFGRPDAALAVFERLRGVSQGFTMDSAPDLRTLAEYAEGSGREELAASMRLETPVFHPPR